MNQEQYKVVTEAMDLHAGNIAVMFSDWVYENGYFRYERGIWFRPDGEGIAQSTKELYNQFTQIIKLGK
jgi:hypothetical protein